MRRTIFPLFLFLTFSLLLDNYVYTGLLPIFSAFPASVAALLGLAFWLVEAGILIAVIVTFARSFSSRSFPPFFYRLVNIFLTLLVTRIVFSLAVFAGDIGHFAMGLISVTSGEAFSIPERSLFQSVTAMVVAAVPFFAFLFGMSRGKFHYKVHRVTLEFEDLPPAFHGFKIAQISDVHSGSLDANSNRHRRQVKKGIDLINAQQADLFIFTGDLVNNKASEVTPWVDLFSQIRAPFGQFSVLGNHDYGDYVKWENPEEKVQNLASLKDAHREMGFRLLLDEHVMLRCGQEGIALLGIENWGLGFGERGDLARSLSGVAPDLFKLLLSHDPSHWDAQVKNHQTPIHVTFSGHTHGMQFGIELFGWKWSPVKYRYKNWAGVARENGRYLYVNRGFGFLGFSGRVGIWPEITVLTLKRKGHQEHPLS